MASPQFDGNTIFDSIYKSDGTHGVQGILRVGGYNPISQRIHFEGATIDTYLTHGYNDMDWTYQGSVYGYNQATCVSIVAGIQYYIDRFNDNPNEYYSIQDNLGLTWDMAQIHSMSTPLFQATGDGGCVALIQVQGCVQGAPSSP